MIVTQEEIWSGGKREETGNEWIKAWEIMLIRYSIKGLKTTVVYNVGDSVMEDGF